MIEKLTAEQEAKLGEYLDKWLKIGLRSGACDREAAEKAIDLVYKCAKLAPPKIKIWLQSPLEGAIGAYLLSQVGDQVRAQVRDQVRAQVGDQVRAQVRAQVGDQVWAYLLSQVGDQVWAQVGDQVWAQVRAQVYKAGYGAHDSGWLSFYDFFYSELGMECCAPIQGLVGLAQSGCGWFWPFENAVILTECPIKLFRDDANRLHHETGPAIAYQDGFGVYCWHGVRISREIIEHPETIKPEDVLKENNQEIRRVMLERYGWDKLLRDLNAIEIHTDTFGVLYETTRLREYLEREDEKARFVHVKDPSTSREYTLRVPFTINTAQEAVAWTFGLEGKDAVLYAPEQET